MELIILVIHIFLALAIIATVLLQPPESGSIGGLGSSNTMAGASSAGQGNLLTRMTAIFATGFIITSLALALISGHKPAQKSILDDVAATTEAPEVAKTPEAPKVPTAPSVPLTK